MLTWVRLKRYCELSGDTPAAVRGRLKSGRWLRDIHARRPEGSEELWVNLDAVNDWAAGRLPTTDHGKPDGRQ
ncbi:excisionase [Aquabacterium sp.]|uniref:excisionase n=1 Tax=Aquabacterium sp. TaxID=1872578 RepID=UPI0037849FB7